MPVKNNTSDFRTRINFDNNSEQELTNQSEFTTDSAYDLFNKTLLDEDSNYIYIHNDDNDDDSIPSYKGSSLNARGVQGFPEVEIYAYLPNPVNTLIDLDKFNNAIVKLTSPKIKKDYYDQGISVIAPHSGKEFILREVRTNPSDKGVTSARYTFRGQTPPSDQEIALTVMNMIENVISKGNPLNLRTNNPFVAKITELYVEKLKESGLNIDYTPPANIDLNNSKNMQAILRANTVFDDIDSKMKIASIKDSSNLPWYAAARTACEPKPENRPTI